MDWLKNPLFDLIYQESVKLFMCRNKQTYIVYEYWPETTE